MNRLVMIVIVACCASGCGPEQSQSCREYVACVEINSATPTQVAQAQASFGPTGHCWTNGSGHAEGCTRACAGGIDFWKRNSAEITARCGF